MKDGRRRRVVRAGDEMRLSRWKLVRNKPQSSFYGAGGRVYAEKQDLKQGNRIRLL